MAMAYLAKQKLMYYKKYRVDIWSFLKNTLQVLHDNTVYKVNELDIDLKHIRYKRKKIKKVYLKYKLEERKLRNFDNVAKINYKQLKKTLSIYKRAMHRNISKIICIDLLFKRFMKLTISKKLSRIFELMITETIIKKKIYYRKPFIYETREPITIALKRKIKDQFVSLKLMKLFYVIYNYRQIKKIAWKAKHKRGVFEHNYLLIMESKLPSYLYRTSFFSTVFESLDFVKGGNVWVNKKFKPLVHYTVKLFDVVGFRVIYKAYIWWSFFKRLRRKAFIFIFSRCLYVSFHFLFTILISRFSINDMINTFPFDYYRIANYAQ